ncbi:MAG TPA: host attachment protein [Bryobacteraceae bacterium]|nr:host attachment protein [Bryobacteraceae bacterium]
MKLQRGSDPASAALEWPHDCGLTFMTLTPTLLDNKLLQLATFQPSSMPVLSVYLNTQPDQHGRANYDGFLRKQFKVAAERFATRSAELDSFERDASRVNEWLRSSLEASANGAVIFASWAADGFFDAVQFDAPVSKNELYVYSQPHIFGLARIQDQYPRYAVLLADTTSGRTFTFGLGKTLGEETVSNTKMRDMTEVGRWSRAKEDSRQDNYRRQHASELIEQLDTVVRSEQIDAIVLAGDGIVLPTLRDQLSPYLAERVIATLPLDIRTPEHEIRAASHAALREHDTRNDKQRVRTMMDHYHSGGRAAGGVHDVLAAFARSQVEELFVGVSLDEQYPDGQDLGALANSAAAAEGTVGVNVADVLITRAVQTGARITFIEDDALLSDFGGVAATLRYTL